MVISQIENIFLEIENLIKLLFHDKTLNQPKIEQKFEEGKELINRIDDDDEYGLIRYKYHATYANYLTFIGEIVRASKQEELAKKFKNFSKKLKKIDTYKTESRLFIEATLSNINQGFNIEKENKEDTQETVEKELENIQNILENNIIKSIRESFKRFNVISKSFEDYRNIVTCETILLIDLNASLTSNTNNENRQQLTSSLNILKSLASKSAYSNRLAFIYHTLNSKNKKEILFGNTIFTEEEINKRFRDIALYFHSDKTNRPNTATWLQEKHQSLGAELLNSALEFKKNLLNDLIVILQNKGYMTFHENKAYKLWKITIDYHNAAKGQWKKLKLLNEDDIKELSSKKLKLFVVDSGMLAYQEYRAACKIADQAKLLKKQVELRENIALCLYIANKFLEANLFALSAIKLQLKNYQRITQQDFIKTKKIFDKVKGGNPMTDTNTTKNTKNTTNQNTAINLIDKLDNTMALIKIVDQKISLFDKKSFQDSINNDIVLKADRSLVRYQVPKEVILHAKNRALKHKAAGIAAMGGGISIAVASYIYIYQAATIIGISASVAGSLALIVGLGIWAGIELWNRATLLLEETEIREKLNNIMIETLKAYDEGNYQKFLDELSVEFKADASLLKLEDCINTDYIIDTLLNYGFRSDGIAYLLNLLGEVLSSRKIKVKGKTAKDIKALATNAFDGVLSEKLRTEAKTLDNRIFELRKKYNICSTYIKFKDFISLEDYSDLDKECKDDSQEMPFQSRLEEVRNITKINQAIFDILDDGKQEIERAIRTIKDVQNSIDCNYQFVNTAKWRHEALEDLLWIVGGEESPKEPSKESPKLSLITYIDNDEYVGYLNKQLQQASLNQEKIRLYNKIAVYYEQLAEKEGKTNHLDSLCHWISAQKNYEKARVVDPENLDAALGIAKCLLKLSKYTKVIQLPNTIPNLTSLSEYWYFRGIAYYKKADYKNAKENIIEALKLDNKNKLADEQRLILKKLSEEKTIKWRMDCYEKGKKTIKYEMDYLKSSYGKESPTYNILSIDGGGVCGILPALWLSEIEYRTHRPISCLFNMIAGTSTGGIIAAGLSVPSWEIMYDENNVPYYICSNSRPKFSASDILNLYQNQVKDLFTKNDSWKLFKPRYTDKDRNSLFFNHFGNVRLNKALTELVIPAVDENNLTRTHLFTRYDDRPGYSNDTFFDTLMATTAAPTFFPPYEIKGRGFFIDGALHLNNPAMAAYEKAIQYNVAKEKISVLSLGTGGYMPGPLNPDLHRGNLFWAQNLHKVVLPQQKGNTDRSMYSLLGNHYQRWQVWFEEKISLDDYKSVPYLLELGHQYIEELDASDENPINKLIESFEFYAECVIA
ncbi:hypothetical protein RhiirC2_829957 [Rhizophagus irregularis]|uniref:PNPLA domain-containing protein n=1 Tax=Rhizophagus irregularis TaxID=588596 RepID=A0A2N1N9C5_9GLOM|nr:hypothetical protein RhiirC2_829957 [Rhizophagus irregularis]